MNSSLSSPTLPRLTPADEGLRAAATENPANNSLDLYANQVIYGDCLQVLRGLPDACADLVLTDPPYVTRYRSRDGRTLANDDNSRWLFPAFAELYRVLKPNAYCLSFYGWGKAHRFISAWRECGFSPVGHFVWVKRYASCTRHTKMKHEQAYLLAKGNPPLPKFPPDDVLPWKYTGNVLHPTQKSADSLMPIIQAYSKPGGIVLDPLCHAQHNGCSVALVVMWLRRLSQTGILVRYVILRHIISLFFNRLFAIAVNCEKINTVAFS